MNLYYFFNFSENQEASPILLDPENSDSAPNATVLNGLVGTLVKVGVNGGYSPYLAEEYWSEDQGKTWLYRLRESLTCEDGTSINSESFRRNLLTQLRKYSAKTTPVDFNLLSGWDRFLKGDDDFPGIQVKENTLIFQFDKSPEDLNGYLRMAYFGFWCPKNFDGEKWNGDQNFISSGAYKLDGKLDPKRVRLQRRENWFSVSPLSPQHLTFSFARQDQIEELVKNDQDASVIVQTISSVAPSKALSDFEVMKGSPYILYAAIFNAEGPSKLNLVERNSIRRLMRKLQHNYPSLNAKTFYVGDDSENESDSDQNHGHPLAGKTLRYPISGNNKSSAFSATESLVKDAVSALGGETLPVRIDDSDRDAGNRMADETEFDFRLGGVVSGGTHMNTVIKMMFCTTLGVRFPDPSGRICRLVKKHEEIGGPVDDAYKTEFSSALVEDSSVVPVMHAGIDWLMKNVSRQSVPPATTIPRFEEIRSK